MSKKQGTSFKHKYDLSREESPTKGSFSCSQNPGRILRGLHRILITIITRPLMKPEKFLIGATREEYDDDLEESDSMEVDN
ncbi:hypothetical protein RCL_jg1211.t1 [Rhizophagus clarus]|uniref:Uncharacterized protein n=1 Tax=Rhizophagus clarus TaxID=94130 RepID=A0A8H3QL91_9GLOM|nr:hypothetical protein RCL_jg1211.t1 [Rhizophagus clarus]